MRNLVYYSKENEENRLKMFELGVHTDNLKGTIVKDHKRMKGVVTFIK